MGQQQVERGEADEPVPAGDPVLAEAPLDQRHPGHQDHLDQYQVGAEQAGEPAGGGEAAGHPGQQLLHAPVGRPEGGDHEQAEHGGDARRVGPPAGRPRRDEPGRGRSPGDGGAHPTIVSVRLTFMVPTLRR
ncbi:hypothetical protein ACGFI4_10185 [Micromonospora carbonacea]|uniref:hypothetical protein n=1 Tax=Micromonospora carbonacea TaxID=47853 RepID=UPI00371FF485